MSMKNIPVFTSPEDALLYYTECQLATLEQLKGSKRTPLHKLRRQRSIAEGMVEQCVRLKLHPDQSSHSSNQGLPRLCEALETLEIVG